MFCRKCGADIPEDSQFCLKCGVAVVVPSVISISPSGTATGVAPALEPNVAAKTSGQPIGTLSSPSTPGTTGNPSTGDPSNGLRLAADKSSLTEPARTALLEHEIQGRAIESNPLPIEQTELAVEPKPNKARASRWARLGIFLCVALASAIIAAVVFVKGDSTSVADLTEKLTSVSLKLGLAAWAVSEVVAGRWLTLKRTWIVAIALYSVAFVLVAMFLGKPAVTKLAELNEEQTQLDRRFAESATGKTLFQPASFASPQVAATSLAEFERYATATERLGEQKEALLGQDPSLRDPLTAYFEATRVMVSATEDLYRFAAEPSRQVHVENGVVIITDPDGYNKRMDAANDAIEKLRLATAALGESVPKEQKQERYEQQQRGTQQNEDAVDCTKFAGDSPNNPFVPDHCKQSPQTQTNTVEKPKP